MYNNVLELNENARSFLSDLNLSCSFAMDDGGRCLLDVINDPLLLQSFLESGSDDNSKDPQDGTSSESAVESPQISRNQQITLSNHISSAEHIIEPSEQMGYSYPVDGQGLLAQNAACSINTGLGPGMTLLVESSPAGPPTYQHASSSGATIHHIPSSVTQSALHQHSPATARSITPLSHSIKSPGQGPSSVHSMPPPSPLGQTRSPLPSHTPSPAPPWSPAPVLSPATSRAQSMPSIAFQQSHNQILQTSSNMTQIVTALASQQSMAQKLSVQQQQQLLLHPQLSPMSSQQQNARLSTVGSPVVTTATVAVTPSMVQIIPAPQANIPLPVKTSHSTVRPIQPKLPQQILPKPVGSVGNQFVSPVVKQTTSSPVTANQRGVGVGIQAGATGQLVIGQGQPGVFSGPQGTIVLNQIIPGMGQSPIYIQGNLANLANLQGLQLTLRPQTNVTSSQTLTTSGNQNNPTLIAALQGPPNQPAQALFTQTKSQLHGQQTIMIPNNLTQTGLTQQNLNLTTTAIPNSTIVPSSQGQGFLSRPNIILSPRMMGPNHGLQLQQIQTPQGPILALAPSHQTIALPNLQTALQNAALGNPQLGPGTVPMHGVMGQSVISGLSLQSHQPPTALQQHQQQQQSLFGAAVPFTSHLEQPPHQVVQLPQALPPQHVAASIATSHSTTIQLHQHQHRQDSPSPKPPSPPKPSKVPCVNLEELLKEHGIVPENTPPPSPDSQSSQAEEPVPTQLQANSSLVQSPQLIAALQSQHQVVVEQLSQNHLGPQLKFALTQDGSVIFHPHASFIPAHRYTQNATGHCGRISTTVSTAMLPTVTTSAVSAPLVTTQHCAARGHSALLARLNAAPAISIPDVVPSLALTGMSNSTSSSITTTTMTTSTSTLVPLTVQSLNVSSSPISSSHVVQSINSVQSSIVSNRSSVVEQCPSSSQNINYMTTSAANSSSVSQSVQSKQLNHVIFGFPPLITSSHQHHPGTVVQTVSKAGTTSITGNISVGNTQTVAQKAVPEKVVKLETRVVGVADNNNGAIAPSHKLQAIPPGVPNEILQKLQKEITDLLTMKNRTPEQQKSLQQLVSIQQKVFVQPKFPNNQGRQVSQPQPQVIRNDAETEKLLPNTSCSGQSSVITKQIQKQQQTHNPPQEITSQSDKQNLIKNVSPHNVHLVNLLNKGPGQNTSLRIIAPTSTSTTALCDSTTSSSNVTPHVRVGNQMVTVPQQRHPGSHQLPNLPSENPQPSQESLLHRPQQTNQQPTSTVTNHSNIIHLKAKTPLIRINSVPKTALINKQLTVDQNYALSPDMKTPFVSKEDACKRLLKYHVFNSKVPSLGEMEKADETFDKVSVQLLDRFQIIKNKYHLLMLKESMRTFPTPESVLLERMFLDDERTSLQKDKAYVAEGNTLTLPPLPDHWKKQESDLPGSIQVKEEESDILIKEDSDNLEAPVIDSCVDVMSPQHDNGCDRSPPTLKRIVIKSERVSDNEFEELNPKKRLKLHNSSVKTDSSVMHWCNDSSLRNSPSSKMCEAEVESINECKNVRAQCREDFHRDNSEEDIMTELRKELNMSPLENEDDNDVGMHQVDFEPPGGPNGLADFEPPIARTEESCDSTLLTAYSNGVRTNADLKYEFDMLECTSEWVEAYANHAARHAAAESEAAVESILSDQNNPSDLDLSGIEGLDDHLEESQQSIPNGIRDDAEESRESELNYIGYHIPKSRGYREDTLITENEGHGSEVQDQVQCAIKSILEMQSEKRSYFDGDGDMMPPHMYDLEKASEDSRKRCRLSPVSDYVGLDTDMGVTSGESDAALDEAVRSILQ